MVKKTRSAQENADHNLHSIGEVSRMTGVKQHVLRYWEKEFPFLQPVKNRVGHRMYTERDVFIVQTIRELLHERGYSIQGARRVLWKILLGKSRNDRERFLNEIRSDLYDMLDAINRSLA
jgi:DNA-binding transcriptional MerR regulator